MTGLKVPAFANVLTIPKVTEKRQFGDESTNHHNGQQDFHNSQQDNHDRNNQNHDNGGKRLKKDKPPRTKLGLFHAKPGSDQGLFPRLKGKPPCNKFCLQGRICDKPHQMCKFDHFASWSKIKMPSSSIATRVATFGLMRRASKPKRSSFPRSTSIS